MIREPSTFVKVMAVAGIIALAWKVGQWLGYL